MSDVAITDRILVQRADFSLADEYARLAARQDTGAIVSFVGKVRDFNQGEHVKGLALEHYPGMTEKALAGIVAEARSRWPLQECTLIHRIGELLLGDQIVLVVVSSAHREAAFEACHFIMDFLKTRAPFWKKELTADGVQRWVEARASDGAALGRWQQGEGASSPWQAIRPAGSIRSNGMKRWVSVLVLGAGAMYSSAVLADEVKVAVAANFKGTIMRIGKGFTA